MNKYILAVCLMAAGLCCRPLDSNDNPMQSEIKHVVILMMENRSFDNVLAWLYDKENAPAHFIPSNADPEYYGLTDETLSLYQNALKDSFGKVVFTSHPIKGTPSVKNKNLLNSPRINPHEPYPHVIKQMYGFDGGTTPNMSGFLQDYATNWQQEDWLENRDDICAVMETYTPDQLPVLYGLARHYAVSDYWFSSVPTQTNANRAFAACGTSEGEVVNGPLGTNTFYSETIWNRLCQESPDTTWKIYWQADMLPGIVLGSYYRNLFPALDNIPDIDDRFEYIDKFHEAARNGQLPDFSMIEPQWTVSVGLDEDLTLPDFHKKNLHIGVQGNDLHPPGDVRTAENFLANVYTSLTANKEAWNNTLLIITFDEHGGLYDHVVPPKAISPDAFFQHGFKFDRFGVRIPTILISPKIEKGTVFRAEDPTLPYDHTSLIATILKWKNVDKEMWAMGKRTAAAPTFENIITRSTPRADAVLTDEPQNTAAGETVMMGDRFCLKSEQGKYVAKAKTLFKRFAQVGTPEEKVQLSFGCGSGPITHGSFVIINNHDAALGKNGTLEITLTHCDCLYGSYRQSPRQWWTVKRVGCQQVGSPICYGDDIYLESHIYLDPFQFIPARLTKRDLSFSNFLTTLPVTHEDSNAHYWTIEKP